MPIPNIETTKINMNDGGQGICHWQLAHQGQRNAHPFLLLMMNNVAIAEIFHSGGADNGVWRGYTLNRRTKTYRSLKRCVQAVEIIFNLAIN